MIRIIVATNNQGKMGEIKEIFQNSRYEMVSLKDINFTDNIVEDQDSFKGNALKKALTVMEVTNEIVLGDDSGLEVDELGGSPGILSARFAGERSKDRDNNEKLLELMNNIPLDKRGAQFRCVMALVSPNGEELISEGICRGTISYEPHGKFGFGYDPLFIPEGYDKTFAQLGEKEKNKISHRAIALKNMKNMIKNVFNT